MKASERDMPGDALVVDGLGKSYGRTHALRGLSFEVPEGAFYGLFGRNGAGKTTTLDIITGLLMRDRGRVVLLGEELGVEPSPETKTRLAYVAGHIQLYDWMQCHEHIRFISRFYPTWDPHKEANLLRMLQVPLRQRVGSLSTGQYLQLQLVMALSRHPELLIIDEPGNLDAVVRRQLMETMIEAIAEQQTTVIMASHIISEMDGVCDHFCIINDGIALATGSTEELRDSVRRVDLAGATPIPAAELCAEGVVSVQPAGGEVRVVVTGYAPEKAAAIAGRMAAQGWEAHRMGLQDIFVALTAETPDGARVDSPTA